MKLPIDKEYDYYTNQSNNSFYIVAFFDNFEDIQSVKGWEATELDALDTKIVGDHKKRIANNCNLIFCIFEQPGNQKDYQLIYQLEEDTFGFKKYVLTYTNAELEDFEKNFEKFETQDILLFLKKTINDNYKFNDFKKNQRENHFSLILKLFIKINNLIFTDSISHENYQELQEIIDSELAEKNLLDFTTRLLSKNILTDESNEWKIENLDDLTTYLGDIENGI